MPRLTSPNRTQQLRPPEEGPPTVVGRNDVEQLPGKRTISTLQCPRVGLVNTWTRGEAVDSWDETTRHNVIPRSLDTSARNVTKCIRLW
jgi:hypothetical protein